MANKGVPVVAPHYVQNRDQEQQPPPLSQEQQQQQQQQQQAVSVPASWASGERTRLLAGTAARKGTTLQGGSANGGAPGRKVYPARTSSFDGRNRQERRSLSPTRSPGSRRHYQALEIEKQKRNSGDNARKEGASSSSISSSSSSSSSSKSGGSSSGRKGEKNGSFLAIVFVIYVLIALMNRLFQKLQTIPMYNYPVFLNLLTTGAYVPISFAYIIPMLHWGNAITPEQTKIPKYKFLVMGMLDCLASAMQIFAVNFITNAGTIVLVQQSAIPISMAVSKLTLGANYTRMQYVGAAVVCAGIFVVLSPQLVGSEDPSSENGHNQVIWAIVMMISCIPMASSSVYKEYALRDDDIDVVYLNGWVATFQFLLCIPLAIPSAWAIDLPIEDLPGNVHDGWMCFLGHSSVAESDAWSVGDDDDGSGSESASGNGRALFALLRVLTSTDRDDDNNGNDDDARHAPLLQDKCEMAPLYVSMYILFNVMYNILVIVILKFGSANIMFLGSTALVPLTNALFCLHFIPGHKPMQMTDFMGLLVIMAGISTYRFLGRSTEGGGDDDEDEDTIRRFIPAGTNPYAMEGCQPLLQSEYWMKKIRAGKIRRTPRQEPRYAYLQKLGISPSPQVHSLERKFPIPFNSNPLTLSSSFVHFNTQMHSGAATPSPSFSQNRPNRGSALI
jgi:drug/metabolite transporter (DMT)-like permease